MNIPKYWARASDSAEDRDGQRYRTTVCRWSNSSLEDARRVAEEAARQLADRFRRGEQPQGRYAYADRPMREEIVEEIVDDGTAEAVITRNSYGSLVLNAARVAFIDVDVPRESAGAGLSRMVKKLFGGTPAPTPFEQTRARIDAWTTRAPQYAGRIYQTYAGFRCAITNQLFEPNGNTAKIVLAELESDPLYRRLCEVQQCFRARLTPKFWRCGAARPPSRYPWDTLADKETFRRWQGEYERHAEAFATCRLVGQFGDGDTLPLVERVLDVHDRLTKASSEQSLA